MTTLKEKTEQIRAWFSTCDISNPSHQRALERAVLILFARQTADEQETESTHHLNSRGFNSRDADFGSAMAKAAMEIQRGTYPYPSLSPKMYQGLAKMMKKYARQIAEEALKREQVGV